MDIERPYQDLGPQGSSYENAVYKEDEGNEKSK